MKLKQNYTNLHLAQLFACSVSTVANIVIAANNLKAHSDHNLDFKVCTKNHKHFIDYEAFENLKAYNKTLLVRYQRHSFFTKKTSMCSSYLKK